MLNTLVVIVDITGTGIPETMVQGCLVTIFTVRIDQSLSPGMYAAYKKDTYPNFRQSLTVIVDILLSHDAKVNKLMW